MLLDDSFQGMKDFFMGIIVACFQDLGNCFPVQMLLYISSRSSKDFWGICFRKL